MIDRSNIKEKLQSAIMNANKKQIVSLPISVVKQMIDIMDNDLEEKIVQSEIISKLTQKMEKITQKDLQNKNTPLLVRPLGIPIPKGCENLLTAYCPSCGTGLWGKGTHYCHWCGQAVKWDE